MVNVYAKGAKMVFGRGGHADLNHSGESAWNPIYSNVEKSGA